MTLADFNWKCPTCGAKYASPICRELKCVQAVIDERDTAAARLADSVARVADLEALVTETATSLKECGGRLVAEIKAHYTTSRERDAAISRAEEAEKWLPRATWTKVSDDYWLLGEDGRHGGFVHGVDNDGEWWRYQAGIGAEWQDAESEADARHAVEVAARAKGVVVVGEGESNAG